MTPMGAHADESKATDGGHNRARSDQRHLLPHQYERLVKIIALLLPRYYYHHKELAEDLGVSTRTLQRDMVALRERGVKIRQDRGGYRCPSKRAW